MKKIFRGFTPFALVVLITLLCVSIVYAATWQYKFPTVIQDTSGSARTYYPVILGYNGQSLIDSGKIDSDGLNTNMQIGSGNISYMMGTTNVLGVVPNLPSNSQSVLDLYTDYTDEQTSFPIIFGEDGFGTILYDGDLELGDNFSIETKGYLDTSYAADKNIVSKANAFETWISGSQEISSAIIDTSVNAKQDLKFAATIDASVSATSYTGIMGLQTPTGSAAVAVENDVSVPMPTSGTFSRMRINLVTAPQGGDSWTFTLMKNAAPTGIVIVIASGETTGTDMTHTADYTVSDNISLKCLGAGVPTGTIMSGAISFEPDVDGETIFMYSRGTTWQNAPSMNIITVVGAYPIKSSGDGETSGYQQLFVGDATISDFYVKLNADPGTNPEAYTFILRKNSDNTTLTTTITADNVTGNDTVHTVDVTTGDLLSVLVVGENAPTVEPLCSFSMVVLQDTAHEQQISSHNTSAPSTSGTRYMWIQTNGAITWLIAETDASQVVAIRQTLSDFNMVLTTAPGAGKSWAFTVMKNGVDTDIVVTISGTDTTGADTAHTVVFAPGDTMSIKSIPSGTPAAAGPMKWGLLVTSTDYLALVTVTEITSGIRTIDVLADSTDLTLEVYDASGALIKSDTTGLGGGEVPPSGSNWVINQNTVMPYMDYYKHSVGGAQVVWYEPLTMVGGDVYVGTVDSGNTTILIDDALTQEDNYWNYARLTITGTTDNSSPLGQTSVITDFDDATDNLTFGALTEAVEAGDTYTVNYGTLTDRKSPSQDGTITWGVNSDLTVVYGAMVSYDNMEASSEVGQYEIPSASLPSTWFASGENMANLPFYDMILDVSNQIGIPVQTIYFWWIIGLAFGVALFLIMFTRSALFGVIGLTIVLFVGSSMTIVPMWIPFCVLILDLIIMFLYRQVSYG